MTECSVGAGVGVGVGAGVGVGVGVGVNVNARRETRGSSESGVFEAPADSGVEIPGVFHDDGNIVWSEIAMSKALTRVIGPVPRRLR